MNLRTAEPDAQPDEALGPDAITVLRCAPGGRATKRIIITETEVAIEGYQAGRHFSIDEIPVHGIHGLAAALDEVAKDHTAFVIRGEPLPGIDRTHCRRLIYTHADGTPPAFREVPRAWVIIDFDDVPGPYRFDPCDGELAAEFCRTLLPGAWHRCSCWWGLSSSAGFKPGVRLKLAFWLDPPVLGREVERHLKKCPIDPATLRPVQPIYVAKPIVEGGADPIVVRSGVLEDVHNAIALPELPAEAPRPAEVSPGEGRRWVSGAMPSMAELRLEGLCRSVEGAGDGHRHKRLFWAAKTAVELDDVIARNVIAEALVAAAQQAGMREAEKDLQRQVRNGFAAGIFGARAMA